AGLFVAILACGLCAASVLAAQRLTGVRAGAWIGAAIAVAIVAGTTALGLSPAAAIVAAMQPIAHLGDSYLALVIIVLVETLLWTAGVHGPAVLAAVVTPVYLTMQTQNTHAYAAHAPLPYVVVVSLFLFVFPGGAGATLPLAVMLAFSRVPRLRRIGRMTIVPGLFNINDPLLVGAPVVFNPYFVIPFVGAPLVLASSTYAAVAFGAVSRAAFYVPSSIPSPIAVYLATLDVRAVGLVLANIAIAAVIYYPFVRAYERHLLQSTAA
ncbi:MAG TPA: PTS transporter subunit EIIC, partial [Candidatus Acidoferrales bacterium]|nr:PTS transporter subunit EIIC [Candidatus Acidoferrales bacterium]